MIDKEIDSFLKNSIGNDSLNLWGLVVNDYSFDGDSVEIESVLKPNNKVDELFEEYLKILIKSKDEFLTVFNQVIDDSVVREINFDFLQEYMEDILVSSESNTRANWVMYCSDNDLLDYLDIKFVYNFNLNDRVIDIDFVNSLRSKIKGVLQYEKIC